MTDPSAAPPPPPPGAAPDQPGKDPANRRKRVAIGINVVLFLGIVTVIVLNGRDSAETPVEAEAAGPAVSTAEDTDESDAFITGMQPASIPTTTTTTIPAQEVGDLPDGTAETSGAEDDGESSARTTSSPTSSTSTTTEPDGPPVLSGELDEDGIPVGLEFPLYNSEHTIIGGENLWLIAANQLASITERPLEDVPQAQIAVYWDRVIDTNRGTLRSGDPNLVYPGEIVRFPGA